MISPSTAALAVSVARGVIKFGQRLDALLAEKKAVQGGLVLVMPAIYQGPPAFLKVKELRQYLAAPVAPGAADPLGPDREELARELAGEEPDGALVGECYRKVFPERLAAPVLRPDEKYVAELRRRLPGFDLSDGDALVAAFQLTAGKDDRELGYGARVGLLVADVVAEFGAQNATLFVRDPGVRQVVQSVLERFAKPELETFTSWSPLLRHALSATLNGLLDARAALVGDTQWLAALLEVLVAARDDPRGGDEFLAGLFQGRGYTLLLSKGLGRAAEALAEDQADAFRQLAAGVLKAAVPLAAESASFKEFFSDHWGDFLRAGLQGLERHGPAVLKDQPELLREVLVAMVKEVAEIPQANLLNHETLFRIGDAAIAAVAAKPELLEAEVKGEPWLRALLKSFVNTIARDGVRLAFSREGLDDLVTDAAAVFAEHPELLTDAENAGLLREVAGRILRAVSELPSLDARSIATAAAAGALRGIAAHPGLADTRYAKLIAGFCERLAVLVQARTLTGLDASAIAEAAVETLSRNPEFFDAARANLATAVLDALLRAAGKSELKLLAGATLVGSVRAVLGALARSGKERLGTAPLDVAVDRLSGVLKDTLDEVAGALGRRLDLAGVPGVLGGVVEAWARGDFDRVDPETPAVRDLLARLLAVAPA